MLEIALPKPGSPPAPGAGCIVAVDAGATKTAALALDLATGERRRGLAAAGNPEAVGLAAATDHLLLAATEASGGQAIDALLIACAGTDIEDLHRAVTARTAEVRHLDLVNDVVGAWGAATGGDDGVALICGTGSHGVGVAGGRAIRVGGWGHVFGDEGSAWELGRAAIAARLRMLDGRQAPTALADLLDAQLGEPEDAIPALYRSASMKSDVAALAPVVDAAAAAGDPVATAIIEQAAADLVAHIAALATALQLGPTATVGLVGSTWRSESLLAAFRAGVAALDHPIAGAEPAPTEREPVEGTLLLLERALGLR